ncbi:hypothetical protein OUZ56_027861 [Daphnia magna]|uniref:Uncharacterized protein n=1 Tax=Daphnia magna TaxID=35525 RepID=A0ABR0B255_9CRUS|nr:hypothetical protein OUZ56_027861 [Daphnia magna]
MGDVPGNAACWISKHIQYFGGDPSQITSQWKVLEALYIVLRFFAWHHKQKPTLDGFWATFLPMEFRAYQKTTKR